MTLGPDSHLDRFRIVRRLGAGSMGEVYLAQDPQIARFVAIKTIRLDDRSPLPTVDLRVRLLREAKAAGRLVHPHIVTLFDVGQDSDLIYLVFEYVDGSDLASHLLHSPPLAPPSIVQLACEITDGLAAAHEHGVVHRDIKPANLLIDRSGSVKISDFGIAKIADQHTNLTQSGSLVGTPQYLSPEQIHGESEVDGRSDLFSLGVVLYELLSGQRPFRGDTLSTMIYEVLNRDPVDLSKLARLPLPDGLADAVMRLLAKDPEDRYPSAQALHEDFVRFRQESRDPVQLATDRAAPSMSGESEGPVGKSKRRVQAILVGVGTACLMVAASLTLPCQKTGAIKELVTDNNNQPTQSLLDLDDHRLTDTREPADVHRVGEPPARPSRPAVSDAADSTEPATSVEGARVSGRQRSASTGTDQDRFKRSLAVAQGAEIRVGGAMDFEITPLAAARTAIVEVDGIVRGPASGSLITLADGRHQIKLTARGFQPFQFEAVSGAGELRTVTLFMHRK